MEIFYVFWFLNLLYHVIVFRMYISASFSLSLAFPPMLSLSLSRIFSSSSCLSGMCFIVGLMHSPISLIKARTHRWYLPLISPSVRMRRESYRMFSMYVSGLQKMNRMQRVKAHSHWPVSREVWPYVMPRSIDTSSIIRFIATCLETWQFVYLLCEWGKWFRVNY